MSLTQSVFGNLKLESKLDYLCEITDDEGKPISGKNRFIIGLLMRLLD